MSKFVKIVVSKDSENEGLLTANLGGAQSAFHPVHSPSSSGCRVPKSPSPSATVVVRSSGSLTPTGTVTTADTNCANLPSSPTVISTPPISLLTLQPMTPPGGQSDNGPLSTPSSSSPNMFSPTLKNQSGTTEGNSKCQSFGPCQICSDRATGKHYGANSCDGCKGFFRRTVRKDQHYTCRFSRDCLIDKDKRNTCRYCRFKKCINAGMRRDAVQNERDRISVKRSKSQSPTENPPSCASDSNSNGFKLNINNSTSCKVKQKHQRYQREQHHQHHQEQESQHQGYLTLIQQAEKMYATARSTSVIMNNYHLAANLQNLTQQQGRSITPRLATVNDLADSIKQQLLLLVEWAKSLPPFYDLSLDDQVTLLRAYAAEHLLLGVARRSLPYKDVLLLSNDACIPRSHSSEIHDVNRVVFRILDELVEPMREMQLDDTENGCLKALMFFNPSALGLSNRQKVKETRQNFLEVFSEYITHKESTDKVRFGNLLLLLPPLQAMSQQFIEDLQLATLFGMATFDKLLEELLLAAAEPLSAPFLTEGITAVASKMAAELNNSMAASSADSIVIQVQMDDDNSNSERKVTLNGSSY